jgi:hypothetical protein
MKFSTRADVDAPAEDAFAAFADFPRYVRLAEARGATGGDAAGRPVFAWRRGSTGTARRASSGDVTRFDPPRGFTGGDDRRAGWKATLEVEVTPVDAGRSQVRVAMEWRPVTMAGGSSSSRSSS